ncbi:uncharacterized protein LOC107486766 [Arachis duranensis]|uniref:Uncharacterized protein LOC107486766 n=1 Tax=Arachis duranensis TaxID=130453 RepID=A0A6P4D811_ARADU|nr:uncharacterized protein LOC107486766 [Arachis duranensis]
MADSTATPYTTTKPHSPFTSRIHHPKPSTTITRKGKSCSGFILKCIFLSLFLVALPLFPSQAPDFVSQTILTKFWELLHLLFVGIAVAYGLFSRRHNVDLEFEPSQIDTTHSVSNSFDSVPSSYYVPKMFPDSEISGGDETENLDPCVVGYDDDKRLVMNSWDANQYFENGGAVGVLDEQYNKPQLQDSSADGGFGYSVGYDGNNVVQSWNSEYYHSGSVVMVAQPYKSIGEFGGQVDGYRPLGLPVRSLRSVPKEVDGNGTRYANESDCSRVSSKGSDKGRDREFGDLGASNLDNRFNAGSGGASASPIPWNLRPRKVEREKRHGNVSHPSHFRPLSVDETKFEAFGSRSLQSSMSFSSLPGMYSSFDSIPPDNMNFQEEEMNKRETSLYVPASEKMNFQEEDTMPKTSYVPPAVENMSFPEEDKRQRKTSFVPASQIANFHEEDTGQRKKYYVPASENSNFKEVNSGKKISQASSSRNRRVKTKGKYAAVSYPLNFRPIPVDETPNESHGSQPFQSMEPFTSHTSMHSSLGLSSSDNMNVQREDMEQQKTSPVHVSENMNFKEEEMAQMKIPYVHDSEDVNFQEEDMEQQKNSCVSASENTNFQEAESGKVNEGSSSRTARMGAKGKRPAVSHLMPTSETQFESLSSRSFQSTGSFSSRASLDSVSSENMNLQREDLAEKRSPHGSYSNSSSPQARSDGETSLRPSHAHARGYSIGSLLEDDMKSDMNDDLGNLMGNPGDRPENKKLGMHALRLDSGEPTSLAKSSSRGKSVRTRRAGGLTSWAMRVGETPSKQTDEKVEKKPSIVESVPMRKDKVKVDEVDLSLKEISKKSLESYPPKPEFVFSSHLKRDKPEPSKKVSNEDLDIDLDLEDIQMSSDDERMSECINDSGLDSEVDKKASEFIAKFKEQIRLQKSGSVERSKGQKIMGNYIR